jgi:hypothetical protein
MSKRLVIVPYDTHWPEVYQQEKAAILGAWAPSPSSTSWPACYRLPMQSEGYAQGRRQRARVVRWRWLVRRAVDQWN